MRPAATYATIGLLILLRIGVPLTGYLLWYQYEERPLEGQMSDLVLHITRELHACQGDAEVRLHCQSELAKTLLEKYPLVDVMLSLESAEADPKVYARCHSLTHYLGREEYRKGGDIRSIYPSCNEACWGGCYHGVVEAHLENRDLVPGSDDAAIVAEIIATCGSKNDYALPLQHSECLHGLGHALMYVTSDDLFRSLEYCDVLGKDEAVICYGGVFMENSSASTNKDHPPKHVDPDDPMYPCTVLPERYLATCYAYQSSHFRKNVVQGDWQKVAELCMQAPLPYRVSCFESMGSGQIGHSRDYSKGRTNCAFAPEPYEESCIKGMVGPIGLRSPKEPERMFAFCAELSGSLKAACYDRAGDTLSDINIDPSVRERLCMESIDDVEQQLICLGSSEEDMRSLTGD